MKIKTGKKYNLTKAGLIALIEKKNPLSLNSFAGTIYEGEKVLLRKCTWTTKGAFTSRQFAKPHPFTIISEVKRSRKVKKII